jgi:uncharacterized protein (DUF342 family)
VAECAEWTTAPLPENLQKIADESVLHTPAPEMYRVRFETVTHETKVKKASPLPFLPAKEETVVTSEKREIREPISYDTQVTGSAYVKAGDKVGFIVLGKPGKPGKSVYGRPIPAPRLESSEFLLNDTIKREGKELIAAREGFLRYGKQWADIIPFLQHNWSVHKSADGTSFLLDYDPGDERLRAPHSADILAAAVHEGAGADELIDERSLDEAILASAQSREPLLSFMLSRDSDSAIDINLSPDGLKATLSLRKGRGHGRPLDLRALSQRINSLALKVKDPAKFKADVLAFYKGPQIELKDYLLAEGKNAGVGKDRTITYSVSFLPEPQTKAIAERLANNKAIAGSMRGADEFALGEIQKLAFVQEGKQVAALSRAEVGTPGEDIFGKAIPGAGGKDPKLHVYDNLTLEQDIVKASVGGALLFAEKNGEPYLRVLPYRDAEIKVVIAPNLMSAKVSLTKEDGAGMPLTAEEVKAELKNQGVVAGINEEAIAQAVATAKAEGAVRDVAVAEGKPPVAVGATKINWISKRASGKNVTIGTDGKADFRNQDKITGVAPDELVAEIVCEGASGEAGEDIRGKKIEPEKPEKKDEITYDGTIRAEKGADGVTKLYAAKAGEIRFEKNHLSIVQSHAVKGDVNFTTGNLKLPGDVQISGSVAAGFMVMAGGSVNIGGGVEASLVSATGAVKIGLGIKGQSKGTIRANQGIELLYAEKAALLAVEDIKVKNSCMGCVIKTNGKLILSSDKGILVGGRVRARKGMEVQTLGSENGVKTEVSFGQDYLIADQLEAERAELERLKGILAQFDKRLAEFEKQGKDPSALRIEKVKLLKLIEKRSVRLLTFSEQFEEHFPSEIRVRGTIYPGVVLESHNRFHEVRAPKSKVIYLFDPESGRIEEKPLTK